MLKKFILILFIFVIINQGKALSALNSDFYNYKISYKKSVEDKNAFDKIVKKEIDAVTSKSVKDLLNTNNIKYYKKYQIRKRRKL